MTKSDYLLLYLNSKKVPQNIIKDAARDSKRIAKANIMDYAERVVEDYQRGAL